MADEPGKANKMAGAIAALERLAETPNESRMSMRDRLAEPALYEAIQKAKRAKRTNAEIAAALTAEGVKLTAGTLAQYLRKIEAEKSGGTDGKRGRKKTEAKAEGSGGAKGTPPPNPDSGTGTEGEKGSGSNTNDTGTKPATGKTLTQKPGMGGAFGTDEL